MASTLDFVRDPLPRRMRTMHSLYGEAADTMALGQVNTVIADRVLPIAFPVQLVMGGIEMIRGHFGLGGVTA